MSPSIGATGSGPWAPADWDGVVVAMLATGLVELSGRLDQDRTVTPPYPMVLQRALDRLTAMGLTLGGEVPRSVMDLADWAHRPVSSWPISLGADQLAEGETLLRRGVPTQACLELAVLSGDVEGEVRERALIQSVMQICREHHDPDLYVRFRRLLVQRPAMAERDLMLLLGQPEYSLVAAPLRSAYQPAPPEATVDGEAIVCDGCGQLWALDSSGRRRCQEWDCPNPHRQRAQLPAASGVVWLSRELRQFICAPGRAELRIAEALERDGIDPGLWHDFDAADVFPQPTRLAADVKSWRNPVRLARRLDDRPWIPPEGSKHGYIVIAREHTAGRGDYLRVLTQRCQWLKSTPDVTAITERGYLRVVRQAARGGTR